MTRLSDGFFDVVIGNVPFADVRLHDPRHNAGGHSLHNHFIIKSLALTRPGGLVAVLTSHYTLDAANPAARREMGALADLVAAVRLPTGAHRRTAGTDALMDLLILRRREPDRPARDSGWETTRQIDVDGHVVRVNSYLVDHPDRVLGDLSVGQGMYGSETLQVRPRGELQDTPARLHDALERVVSEAREEGLGWVPRAVSLSPAAGSDLSAPVAVAPEGVWDGHITAQPDGSFTVASQGTTQPLAVPASHRGELRALLELRDSARALLMEEAATFEDTAEIAGLRVGLRAGYERYQARYGAINRFSLRRTGRSDPKTGEERLARVTPAAVRVLRGDPFAPLVQALENFDETTRTARPAGMLSERVVVPRARVCGADSPQDALAICLDTHGRVDLEQIARLLGVQSPTPARSSASSSTTTRHRNAWSRPRSTCQAMCASSSTKPATPPATGRKWPSTFARWKGCCRLTCRQWTFSRGWGRCGSTPIYTGSSWRRSWRTRGSRSSIPAARCGRSRAAVGV